MQPLFQSTFLQALGFGIANSLWQTALIGLLVFLANKTLSLKASAKYRLAVFAQLTSFLWFIITIRFYSIHYNQAWQISSLENASGNPVQAISWNDGTVSSLVYNGLLKAEGVLPYISLAYLLLLVFLCFRWISCYRATQELRNSGLQKIPVDWRLFVKKTAAQLGIHKEIRLFLSEKASTPVTMGFLKPVILLPLASINHLSSDQMEAVLLHELAHIKRYDYLLNLILSLTEISLFFNPFTQLLSRSIRKEREHSCDDWVLQFQYNATEYAEALLRIARLQTIPVFAMGATGKKNELLTRVQRMVHRKENKFHYQKQLLAFCLMTIMLCSVAWLSPVTGSSVANTANKGNTGLKKPVQTIAKEPMAVSISNPFFNPVFFLSAPLKKEMNEGLASAKEAMATLSADNMGLPGENTIETIPALVANALQLASAELAGKNIVEKSLSTSSLTNPFAFEKLMGKDSLVLSLSEKQKIQSDLQKSMAEMKEGIARSKKEMALARQELGKIDTEKMKKDIAAAMREVKQIQGLDAMVMNAIQIPITLFSEEPLAADKPNGDTKKKLNRVQNPPVSAKEKVYEEEIMLKDEDQLSMLQRSIPINEKEVIVALKKFVESADAEKYLTDTQLAGLKKTLTEWEKTQFLPKILPVLFREDSRITDLIRKKHTIRL